MMKFLVIEDHQNIVDVVKLCISLRWPTAEVVDASDGSTGLTMAETESPDVIILDIGLPLMDGFQVLQELRRFSNVPVIMLTVRDQDTDVARALQMGADDYVTKPFSHVEFLARVEAVLRRTLGYGGNQQQPLVAGELWVDFGSADVLMKDKPIRLTATELRLLSRLMMSAGRVITHQALMSTISGADESLEINSQTVKVHMQHLRSKLGDTADNPHYIANIYGVGYKFLHKVTPATPKLVNESDEVNKSNTPSDLPDALSDSR